ncbi:GntR family transcriptional regulator [Oceanobacillus jeddahense]|uniref:GntR family transcriptional regulator n=1 Tax=Oceanobacillus jeddahense TaxID=1462527 RepID=A0ABY5JRS4_9BACI|nr:GntR family transcriptional regulator [Oceanobacillus jeddahense]UUI03028.1 GntR family transcriptional regulator [Oceanobacillus jeddahense]
MDYFNKWLKSNSLGENITQDLRMKIIYGEIPKETVLTENQMSTLFKTSRSPVREAFKTLSSEGLVKLGRMGAVVQGLSKKDIDEIYDVRFLVEGFCLKELSATFDDEKSTQLYKVLDMMELSAKYNSYIDFAYYDLLFHETIIQQTNHKRMLYLWDNIRHIVLCLLIVATETRFQESAETDVIGLIANHKLIIENLIARNYSELDTLVKKHYLDTKSTVVHAYLKKIKEVGNG